MRGVASQSPPSGGASSSRTDLLDRLVKGLDDIVIAGGIPFRTSIGPDRRVLTVRCLPLVPWSRFQNLFALFVIRFYSLLQDYEWPGWEDYEKDKKQARLVVTMQRFLTHSTCKRMLLSILRQTLFADLVNRPIPWWKKDEKRIAIAKGWEPPQKQGMSFGYFLKHVTADQLLRIWMAVYVYNISAVKKNARSLAVLLQVELEPSSSSSPKRSDGTWTGSCEPRYPNSPFLRRGGVNGKVIAIESYLMNRDGSKIEVAQEGGGSDG